MTVDVVITGRGVASPVAGDGPAFAQAMRDGAKPEPAPFPGATAPDPPLCLALCPPAGFGERGRAEPVTALATAVAREALSEAGVDLEHGPRDDVGLVVSTVLGPSASVEAYLERLDQKGPRASRPVQFIDTLPSMPGSRVGIALGLRGSTAVIGGSNPFELALEWLRDGRDHTVVAGGTDMLSPKCARYYRELVARSGHERPPPSQAAAFVVLEAGQHARERGATPVASLRGSGAASEPQDLALPWGDDPNGRAFAIAMRNALDDAGVAPADVRTIALASGDDASEAAERAAIASTFGAAPLVVLRPKRSLGEALAASAGLGLLAAIALSEPGIGIVNAFEFGGSVTSLVLELP